VVIGISRYKNSGVRINDTTLSDLVSASDDARKFYDFLRSPEGGGFRDEKEGGHMVLLEDENATKKNVEAALKKLQQARPEDYFVVYIAAHGANVPVLDSRTRAHLLTPYFIMHDFDAADVANTAIEMTAFRDLVGRVGARKGLVISDTCHSAGVLLAGRGMFAATGANARFIDEMNRVPAGVGFLAASGQLETSQEADEYGGLFTHCLLEALRGNADGIADGNLLDGIVTFKEVRDYVLKAVPELSDKVYGMRQTPVYRATTWETERIPLAIVNYPKPGGCENPQRCGTLVIRAPEIDGVEVLVNGASLGAFGAGPERTVRVPAGAQTLVFAKGPLRRELKTAVDPGKSKVVEVNLSFSESEEESLAPAPAQFAGAFLGNEKPPSKEAEKIFLDGVEHFNKQRFAEAIKDFERAAAVNGGAYPNALVYAGRAWQGLRQDGQAVTAFTAALKYRPTDFETRTLLADAKSRTKSSDLREVLGDLRQVVAAHPSFDFARVVYGDALFLQFGLSGDYRFLRDAEQQLRSAIAVNPNSPQAHLALANVLLYAKSTVKREEAVKEAEKALELYARVQKKKTSFARGLRGGSITHVIFAAARYEDNAALAEANYILGKALTNVVNSETAAECDNGSLKVGEQSKYLDRARSYLDTAGLLARQSKDQERLGLVLYESARNHLLKGNLAGALKDANQAMAMPEMKEYFEVHLLLFEIYKSLQQFSKAADAMKTFIRLANPTGTYLEQLKEELRQMEALAEANRKR
jgi:tetratricopeptide (TPR) repeat protein